MAEPLLASSNIQEFAVQRAVPPPGQPKGGEGFVERLPVQLLGFRKGAVDIEDQGGRLHAVRSVAGRLLLRMAGKSAKEGQGSAPDPAP